jgi:hypothetical protein
MKGKCKSKLLKREVKRRECVLVAEEEQVEEDSLIQTNSIDSTLQSA